MSFFNLPPVNDPSYAYHAYALFVEQSRLYEQSLKSNLNNVITLRSCVCSPTFEVDTFHTQNAIEMEYSFLSLDSVLEQSESPQPKEKEPKKRYWSIEEKILFSKAVTFLKATTNKGLNCQLISRFIKTKTTVQVRTHAQKYFLKQDLKLYDITLDERDELESLLFFYDNSSHRNKSHVKKKPLVTSF